jgi:hypothetical protein
MLRRIVLFLVICAALASLASFVPSCGAGMAFGVAYGGSPYYDWAWDPLYHTRVHDGLWRGDYVWYDGGWSRYGYGTPYYWDYYNPYWW